MEEINSNCHGVFQHTRWQNKSCCRFYNRLKCWMLDWDSALPSLACGGVELCPRQLIPTQIILLLICWWMAFCLGENQNGTLIQVVKVSKTQRCQTGLHEWVGLSFSISILAAFYCSYWFNNDNTGPSFLILPIKNLAEAEYAVALFMYMRLLGYPAERISILTTYNGQKHLIRDVLNQRCAGNPVFDTPNKVGTCSMQTWTMGIKSRFVTLINI